MIGERRRGERKKWEKQNKWAEQISFVIPNSSHTQRARKLVARGGHLQL